jgi:hypothetical protein
LSALGPATLGHAYFLRSHPLPSRKLGSLGIVAAEHPPVDRLIHSFQAIVNRLEIPPPGRTGLQKLDHLLNGLRRRSILTAFAALDHSRIKWLKIKNPEAPAATRAADGTF